MQPERIVEEFPAPSYRGAQRQALRDVRAAFEAGNDVVLVRAPTGTGKSLIARAIMGCARQPKEAEPTQAVGAYYTTPQVSQLDDVAEDDLLPDLKIVRGKGNYDCILDGERDTPVDRAPCARKRGYDCAVKHRCSYFSARAVASSREYAATTLAYFMNTAGSEVFGKRDVCVIDEAHGLGEWAEMYAAIDLGPATVPVWEDLRIPDLDGDAERTARFAEQVVDVCESAKDELLLVDELTPDEAGRRDRLQERIAELSWFVEDYRDPDSATTWVVDQGDDGRITIKPMDPERYLNHTIWKRANRFALLSATILDKESFCRSVGLDPSSVALVDVPHTFPVENRPLYDVTQGRMTYEKRDETIPRVAETLVSLMAEHPEEKGLVHAHSYAIQEQLADRLRSFGVGDRVRVHDRNTRDASLEAWKQSDDPEVFLSVKMEEALDLSGDLARWQVLTKAPFPNTNDSRVSRRLADGQWAWYYRTALRTVIQAAGRVVRSPDDYGVTYFADTSLLDLFERARADVPDWFEDALDRLDRPDLPAPTAEDALAGMGGRVQQVEAGGERTRKTATQNQTTANGGDAERDSRSPLSDVWDP
ncbi:helicase C-terminal domain-containing protein [Halanaeroarchaeum sulfurireducens]|uniref:Helicase domain-containing protein n=1 Tax=Halanaeroarchaeum sulfurireducens TaxID=1604004 RepID=A0A0F7PCV5_9EURY|nr:ATP-dependent DNA helicase [Halanaeroarchaeum sulfurireducens]AKH98557.1 helicase domain-containing protein [Halanaeroarchaeum sulfurireducens]